MEGAVFTIRYYDQQFADGMTASQIIAAGGTPERTWTFATQLKNGTYTIELADDYKTSGPDLYYNANGQPIIPLGTAVITETTAPTGYNVTTDQWIVRESLRSDGQQRRHPYKNSIAEANRIGKPVSVGNTLTPLALSVYEPEKKPGKVKINKADSAGYVQGDASVEGIRFALVNASENPVTYDGGSTLYAKNTVIAVLTTDASGNMSSADLEYGTYSVHELRSDASVAAGDAWPLSAAKAGTSVYANQNGYLYKANEGTAVLHTEGQDASFSFTDDIVKGGVKFSKIDAETLLAEPQGEATLVGAEITIYNASRNPVDVNGATYEPQEAVLTIQTAADGAAQTAKDALPYGTYVARETKASSGYKLNADWSVTFSIRTNGEIVDKTDEPLPEELIRADLAFVKVDAQGTPMANIPFAVSRLDENGQVAETHVIVTDANGYVSTADRAKDTSVNTLDAYLSGARFTDDSALDASVNIWFGAGTPAAGKGSLIPGDYLLEELQCAANQGQVMLKQTIATDPFTDGKVYFAGNIFVDIDVVTGSDLLDAASGTKSATFATSADVTDTVTLHHLKDGEQYRLSTEIFYVDRSGSVPVSMGTNDVTFTSSDGDAVLENTVTVDTSALVSGTLCAVDKVYMLWRGEEILIATHNTDLSESTQTVYVPYMETSASDTKTTDHVGRAAADVEISDIVTYEGLADQKLYRVEGVLRDAASGDVMKDADGNDCVVERVLRVSYSASSVAEKAMGILVGPKDGLIHMPAFVLDTTAMQGKTLVVTETLYDYDTDEVIVSHDSLVDEKQSIHIPDVTTTAKDSKTNTHTGTVGETEQVIDTVVITNAIIGQSYDITGTLVYKEDCVDGNGVSHAAGDVIATHPGMTVVAESTTITVDLAFNVDSILLEGVSGVVFEDIFHNDIPVAAHHDLESEEQTINWPKVQTTATDDLSGTHTGVAREEASITDTVALSNLTEGETYRVDGVLMNRETGEPFVDAAGEAIRVSSAVFTADETDTEIEMNFAFDASGMEDVTVVVFEKLICLSTDDADNDIETDVARHEDIDDEGQTIHFPAGHTNASDSATEDEVGMNAEEAVIVDLVSYQNLVVGEEYTVKGTLHYTENGTDAA